MKKISLKEHCSKASLQNTSFNKIKITNIITN